MEKQNKKKADERRRYLRLNVATKINFRVKEGAAPLEKSEALSKNISVEGVCFRTAKQLKPGAVIELEIIPPSEPEPLLLRGEVIWSKPIQAEGPKAMFDTGVKLAIVKESDENRYLRYVNERMMERLSQYLHL